MSKQSNSVENGNYNNQSTGDMTIYQNIGPLETLIIEHIGKDLIPILQKEAISIKETVGAQIREITNQQVLIPLKRDLAIENINYHISVLREQLKHTKYSIPKEKTKRENVERTEIVSDWIEGMEKVPQEEEELSRIWEGWYIDFHQGKKTSNLQLILNKMKDLSSEEAIALLNLNDKEALIAKKETAYMEREKEREERESTNVKKPLLYSFIKPARLEARKKQYLYEQLLKKELIERDTTHKRLIPIMIMGALYIFIPLVVILYNKTRYDYDYSLWRFLLERFVAFLATYKIAQTPIK